MHASLEFLHDLAIVMVIAGITTLIFHKLKQPVVLGYILAGFIIGPHTPPWPLVTNQESVKTLAELGVIFLMFRMGLHFSLRKLIKVGPTALIAALLEILAMTWLGYGLGIYFGWSTMDSLFLGAILSISSTTIIAKALSDLKLVGKPFSQLIFGVLIVEDILGVAMLTLLSGVAVHGSLDPVSVASIIVKFLVFLATVLVLGMIFVPRLLRFIWRFRDSEMLLVSVLGVCFGVALLAAELGYSVALGAFLVGAIMAETREAGMIEKVILPLRDMFSAIFFVAVGMLIEPKLIVTYAVPILVISAGVIIGKVITCSGGVFLAGTSARESLKVGMGLAQIGEFSFIIAQLGIALKVTSEFIYPVAVSVSLITTITTPYLIKSSDSIADLIARRIPTTLVTFSHLYTQRAQRAIAGGTGTPARRRFMLCSVQLVVNLLLVAGLLISAVPTAELLAQHLSEIPNWLGGARGLTWFAAMVVALPLFFSSLRKISQMAELLTATEAGSPLSTIFRAVLYYAGAAAMVGWIFLLSATLIPEWPVLILLLLLLVSVAVVGRQRVITLYAAGKHNFLAGLNAESPQNHDDRALFQEVIQGIEVATVVIPERASVAGKLIREVHLRSTTGATIVAINRNGIPLLNPGPDEELLAGDTVVIMGSDEQLAQARQRIV